MAVVGESHFHFLCLSARTFWYVAMSSFLFFGERFVSCFFGILLGRGEEVDAKEENKTYCNCIGAGL